MTPSVSAVSTDEHHLKAMRAALRSTPPRVAPLARPPRWPRGCLRLASHLFFHRMRPRCGEAPLAASNSPSSPRPHTTHSSGLLKTHAAPSRAWFPVRWIVALPCSARVSTGQREGIDAPAADVGSASLVNERPVPCIGSIPPTYLPLIPYNQQQDRGEEIARPLSLSSCAFFVSKKKNTPP